MLCFEIQRTGALRNRPGEPAIYVCVCLGLNEKTVRDHIRAGARTMEALAEACGAGTDCEACHWQLRELIAEEGGRAATSIESDGAP